MLSVTVDELCSIKVAISFAALAHLLAGEKLIAAESDDAAPIRPKIDPSRLSLGQKLLIRNKAIGKGTEEEIREDLKEYAEQLSGVTEGDDYYVVQRGDTFYSLSKRFGLSEEELSKLNGGLKAEELKAGAMIRIPAQQQIEPEEVEVAVQPEAEQRRGEPA